MVRELLFCAVATVTWSWAADWAARRFGFDAWSETEMGVDDGRPTGVVAKHFDAADKARCVDATCAARGIPPYEAVAVGDARSDLPTFDLMGKRRELVELSRHIDGKPRPVRHVVHKWGRCSLMHRA